MRFLKIFLFWLIIIMSISITINAEDFANKCDLQEKDNNKIYYQINNIIFNFVEPNLPTLYNLTVKPEYDFILTNDWVNQFDEKDIIREAERVVNTIGRGFLGNLKIEHAIDNKVIFKQYINDVKFTELYSAGVKVIFLAKKVKVQRKTFKIIVHNPITNLSILPSLDVIKLSEKDIQIYSHPLLQTNYTKANLVYLYVDEAVRIAWEFIDQNKHAIYLDASNGGIIKSEFQL